ncbi:hypothetical protein [Arthrobacter sp. GCM10027362]|uniref:hypothetical protein n=1 Tax=Arthrobacter sp. GCM10027362 TaxID=3273379 RepID=UPI0036710A70
MTRTVLVLAAAAALLSGCGTQYTDQEALAECQAVRKWFSTNWRDFDEAARISETAKTPAGHLMDSVAAMTRGAPEPDIQTLGRQYEAFCLPVADRMFSKDG